MIHVEHTQVSGEAEWFVGYWNYWIVGSPRYLRVDFAVGKSQAIPNNTANPKIDNLDTQWKTRHISQYANYKIVAYY
jgi:hypothetical protein